MNLAVQVAGNDEVLFAKYMKWDPKQPSMRDWYGPAMYQRESEFLCRLCLLVMDAWSIAICVLRCERSCWQGN